MKDQVQCRTSINVADHFLFIRIHEWNRSIAMILAEYSSVNFNKICRNIKFFMNLAKMNKNLFHVATGQNLFILVPYFKIYLFSFIRRPSHRLFLFGGRM